MSARRPGIPPGLLCAACSSSLRDGLARRTNDGWTHADRCPSVSRRRMPYTDCGQPCRTRTGQCRDCMKTTSPAVLDNGQWVPRGGVRVWQEAS